MTLPSQTPYQAVLPGFTYDIGSKAPFAISRTAWGHDRARILGHITCAQRPRWGAVFGPDAVLLCTGAQVEVALVAPSGKTSVYPLPVHLPLRLPVNVPPNAYGELGGWVTDGYLFWGVTGKRVTSPYGPSYQSLGSGVLDLTTGQEEAPPKTGPLLLSTSDRAYNVAPGSSGYDLLLWTHSAYRNLGPLPDARVAAVDASGTVWADQPDPHNLYVDSLVEERPGSSSLHAWRTHDSSDPDVGPGYIVYAPALQAAGGGTVLIFFPLQRRTLRFTGLEYAPMSCCQYYFMRPLGLDEVLSLSYGKRTKTFLISP